MTDDVNLRALVSRAKKLTGKAKEVFPLIATHPARPIEELVSESGIPTVGALKQHVTRIYQTLQLPRSMGFQIRRDLLKKVYDAMRDPSLLPPSNRSSAKPPAVNGHDATDSAEEPSIAPEA